MSGKSWKKLVGPLVLTGITANFGYHHTQYLKSLLQGKPPRPAIEPIEDLDCPPNLEKEVDAFCQEIQQSIGRYQTKVYEYGVEVQGDFDFKEGRRRPTGKGMLKAPKQGYVMVGEFKDGQLTGKGIIHDSNGQAIYKGVMNNGAMNGCGVLDSPGRFKYVGKFTESAPKGDGDYQYEDGSSCYVRDRGEEKDYVQCFDSSKTLKYAGGWANSKFSGKGTFYFSNGSRYEGEFKDGKTHGYGTLYDPFGDSMYRGEFEDDTHQSFANYFSEPLITVALVSVYLLKWFIP